MDRVVRGVRAAGWSGGQVVRRSGGPGAVVRVVKVFIMARMVPVVQKDPCGAVWWSGGQVP